MMKFPTRPANAKQASAARSPRTQRRDPLKRARAKILGSATPHSRNISPQPVPCKSPGYFFFAFPAAFAFFTFGAGINTAVSSSNSRRRSPSSSSSSATG